MKGDGAADPEVAQQDSEQTFDRLVDEGEQRLGRSSSGLLSTGFLGGLDVGIGVLALLLVEHETGSKLLGGLAFSIGFIALTLALIGGLALVTVFVAASAGQGPGRTPRERTRHSTMTLFRSTTRGAAIGGLPQ